MARFLRLALVIRRLVALLISITSTCRMPSVNGKTGCWPIKSIEIARFCLIVRQAAPLTSYAPGQVR